MKVRYDCGERGENSIVESLGGGVGLLDFDRDGWLDICCPGGGVIEGGKISGQMTSLIRQSAPDQFATVERQAGVDAINQFTHGCSVADYDHDGFPDALITGYGQLTLWRNRGDGTFTDVTQESHLDDKQWSSSAAWGDVNGDGVLDLYIAHYVNWSFQNNPPCQESSGKLDVCPPRQFDGVQDTLYFADGLGGFSDESNSAGLVPDGKGLAVIMADFDHDMDLDIYVANDTTPNFFYRNQGEGHFREEGIYSGVALDDMANANGSMGITLICNNDPGSPDIWVTNFEDELFSLYRNQKNGTFVYASRNAGLNLLGQMFVGFGCVSADFDLDGDEDVAVANGHVVHYPVNAPVKQFPLLMLNDGSERFHRAPAAAETYFADQHIGRGLATGDLNRDGRTDLVFVNSDAATVVAYNKPPAQITGTSFKTDATANGRSLRLRLVGIRSPRDGIGAQAVLTTSKRVEGRQLSGGGSYLSTSDLSLFWGIALDEQLLQLTIHWPSGQIQTLLAPALSDLRGCAAGEILVIEK